MKLILFFASLAIVLLCQQESHAQADISVVESIVVKAKPDKKQTPGEHYVLRLKITVTVVRPEISFLKVALSTKDENAFETVAEERLRTPRGLPLTFEIPITNWEAPNLGVLVMIQEQDPKPDEAPLQIKTLVIKKSSITTN